ncbi:MAG: FAD-binding oxidoreductase [Bradymonadaceae bacterium]|nr:FAD-binding oxidoreductase [Lujinxingiaceae bacterium]
MSTSALSTLPETSAALVRDLAGIVGPQWVRSGLTDRLAYNNDCWPRGIILTRGRRIHQHLPAAIAQPRNEHEVAALVAWARRTGTPIIPYGAGSGVCGGTLADETAVIVDLKRLKRILETREEDMVLRAETGIIGMVLEKELERRGLTLGHFPSSLYCSSLGGYLAARSAGQYSSRYGKIEDMVLSMRVVAGSGEVIETGADPLQARPRHGVPALGPDLTQLFVGSEGTLGLITEATLRIEPVATHRFYRGFQFGDVNLALNAMREMMQAGLRPAVVRLYDAFDSLIGSKRSSTKKNVNEAPWLFDRLKRHASDVVPEQLFGQLKRRVDVATKGLLGRIVGQPLILNALIDVLPADCMLVIGFEGTALVEDEANYAFELLSRYGLDLGVEPGMHWLQNRFNVSYKQSPMFDTGSFVDTMEVSTTWANLSNLYESVRRAVSPYVFVMAHFSHVYPEGSSIYFTFAGFGGDLDDTLKRYEATWKAGLDAVAQSGASIAHHHGVGLSKAAWTHHDHPGGQALFGALKSAFDPDAIMNPGKVYA